MTESRTHQAKPSGTSRPRRWPWLLLTLLAGVILLVGPWPVTGRHYLQADWGRRTLARADAVAPAGAPGPIRFAAARVELPYRAGQPLAGYSGRDPMGGTGIEAPLYARAITVDNGLERVTIVSAEILLALPALRDAVLAKTGLEASDVYFCATHTHSGPGGYAPGMIHQWVLGDFDPDALDGLCDAIARAVRQSRGRLVPGEIRFYRKTLTDERGSLLENRIETAPAPAVLHVLHFLPRQTSRPGALLVTFDAHPTCLSRHNRLLSGDYPGYLSRQLEGREASVVLFAAGAVGSARFRPDLRRDDQAHRNLGRRLARQVRALIHSDGPADSAGQVDTLTLRQARLASRLVWVDLPDPHVRLTRGLQLSPVAGSFVHARRTYIHALGLGDLALTAWPGDFSTELSAQLASHWQKRGVFHVSTSFNGDYIGYLLPERHYDSGHYEAQTMGFFGRWCGAYLSEVSRRAHERIMKQARRVGDEIP